MLPIHMLFAPLVGDVLRHLDLLGLVVILTGITSGLLAAVAVIALFRRRSAPYLLVTMALVALAAKAVVALFAIGGYVDAATHNLVEHGLDFVVATLLIAAIVEARNPHSCAVGRWLGYGTE